MMKKNTELPATLAVAGINVAFGPPAQASYALRDVSVAFRPGELTLVMGPSGSGKTTLLSILGCILQPDAGAVNVMGWAAEAMSDSARGALRRHHIGYVFQAFRLFRALTALENVLLGLEIRGQGGSAARQQTLEALEAVGLGTKARLKPAQLSGGEKQRVAIARSLIHHPTILLADEPTASLDEESGLQIAGILQRLALEKNKIVVVVSHDPRLQPFSQRVVTLRNGRVHQDQKEPL